ncbi:hypothetical protein CASFOL_026887 [Castilleja foliolosa]|uniref:Uncharacterized protein n=1 Tax=Castilleja foliolosa TaxID=1961234 RepID=A0ABD3CLN3_9LAMI
MARVIGLRSSIAGGTHPGVQVSLPISNPHGNETEQSQSQTNAGSQSRGNSVWSVQVGQSGSNPMQNPVGVAIPPIPDSLSTLSEFMDRIELALSQNGTQVNQSPTASGSQPTPEFPVNTFGFPTVERIAGRLDQEVGSSSDPTEWGSLAHLVPVIWNRAPNVEETRGQRVNEAPDLSSVSTSVPQINAQLRHLAANMQSGNNASSGGLSNQSNLLGMVLEMMKPLKHLA